VPTIRDDKMSKYNIPDVGAEYAKVYPQEKARIAELKADQCVTEIQFGMIEGGAKAFSNEDFDHERAVNRWGGVGAIQSRAELAKFKAFVERDNLEPGDILDLKAVPYWDAIGRQNLNQIFRNTPSHEVLFEFGRTIVGMGYVDLCQLMWGRYIKGKKKGPMQFYGYDRAEIPVVRSLLIWEMLKAPEDQIGDKTILQVWFSSCWDHHTKEEFDMFVRKLMDTCDNVLLKKYARVWSKKRTTVGEAENVFGAGRRPKHFVTLRNFKVAEDCVKYARYLYTGCLFMDDQGKEAVCGNATMFPASFEDWERMPGLDDFFNCIGMDQVARQAGPQHASLIDLILEVTKDKLAYFRSLVHKGKVICHLSVKEIKQEDVQFAREIKELKPYLIDWSNIPDYLDRYWFHSFAQKCSGPDTAHYFHTVNWPHRVFGAVYLDYDGERRMLENIYKTCRKSKKAAAQMTSMMMPEADRLMRGADGFELPTNDFFTFSASRFGDKYVKHYLTTKEGKTLNFERSHNTLHDISMFKDHSKTCIFAAFSFDDSMQLSHPTY